jgi:ArsR family transcriptional regulator
MAADMAGKVAEAASLLRAMANEIRLLILCRLIEETEVNVGSLAAACELSQSALSQHLGRLRDEGLVATRRDGQTIWYSIGNPDVRCLIALLHTIYCAD